MTINKLSLSAKAMLYGIKGGDNLKTVTIYNVSRDLIIYCNETNLWWWLRHTHD